MVLTEKDVFDDPLVIQYRGLYDYDGLMELIRGFYARVKIDKLDEPKFKYKNDAGGAEVEFKFEGNRKVTHYIRINLYVEGNFWDVKPQEVVVDGQRKKLTNGKFELSINAMVELDYAGGFSDKKALDKWMQNTLDAEGTGLQFGDNKVTGKKFMEQMVKTLHKEIKEFLNMLCV